MKIVLIILALSLSGCSLFQSKEITVSDVPIEKVPLILPQVDQYQSREVQWVIVTPENYNEIIRDIQRRGSSALFAMTSKNYENLSLNQTDILKLIKQQKELINAYQLYYQADFMDDVLNEETVLKKDDPKVEPKVEDDEFPEIE